MDRLMGNTALLIFEIKGVTSSFRVVQFQGTEAHSTLYDYTVQLICNSTKPRIPAADVLAQSATLTVLDEQGDAERYIHGAVVSFTQGEENQRWVHYTLILRPQVWRLTLRQDCRIFQQQTVPDIIKAVLQGAGIPAENYRLALYLDYEPRNYCVQYQESDFDFIARLMREEGIFYFFEHGAEQHVMVVSDAYHIHSDILAPTDIRYHHPTGLASETDSIYPFTLTELIQSGQVSLSDFNFEKPALNLQTSQQHAVDQDLEVYDYPGRYPYPESGSRYANVRLEGLQVQRNLTNGSSDCRRLVAGHRFTLNQHPQADMNQRYVVTAVSILAKQPQVLGEEADDGGSYYQVDFQCIPAELPYRAADDPNKPKPVITGVQTAIVVGPPGEEIYVDEYGRVKVQFHWDRNGQHNEHSSCWIRVSQGWAGVGWGAIAIPRIGQEVIVDFVNGDPDRPIITGRVYHATNVAPYPLPANKTRMSIQSKTHKGEGFNELRFEDESGLEQVFLHGQKDQDIVIENDCREHIKHDRHLRTDNDRTEEISNDSSSKVDRDRTEATGRKLSQTIGEAHVIQVGNNYHLKTGDTQYMQSGKQIVIESGEELTIRSSGGFIKIDASGITIQGKVVNINTGGSPGIGLPVQANIANAAVLATGGAVSELVAPPATEQQALELDNNLPSFTPNPPVSKLSDAVQQAAQQGLPSIPLSG
ncbi:MAG: type VI secretion system tip protein VgrG [Gammaproteobacteria bacterium]|nr:type VI secretion system tip protein VgrG [Gammaproteobacteria bacterium]